MVAMHINTLIAMSLCFCIHSAQAGYTSVANNQMWLTITSSSDMTKMAAVVFNGNIWTSTDSGNTWTEDASVGTTQQWYAITSSSDGSKLAACVYDGNIWTSTDSGNTWTEDTSVGTTQQ